MDPMGALSSVVAGAQYEPVYATEPAPGAYPAPSLGAPANTQQGTVGEVHSIWGIQQPQPPRGRLVVRCHDFSPSQTEYQAARSSDGTAVFYKDATPRGEHYIRCTVTCDPPQHWEVPLRLAMCYGDGTEVSPQDSSSLKILGDGSRKLVAPREGAPSTFYYRFELGSFRRADRKFCVRISAEPPATGYGAPPIAPAVTPPLLVLSKKKIEPGREPAGPPKPPPPMPDGLRRGQRPAGRKRKAPAAVESITVDGSAAEFRTQIKEIHARLDALDGALASLTRLVGAGSSAVTPAGAGGPGFAPAPAVAGARQPLVAQVSSESTESEGLPSLGAPPAPAPAPAEEDDE